MIHGLKRRIRAFLRAPELELELSQLRREGELLRCDHARVQKDCIEWKRRLRVEEDRRKKADECAERSREFAVSAIPKQIVEWMQLCRHQDFPDSRAVIFYPSNCIRPVISLDQSPDDVMMECRHVKLVQMEVRFMVNHESPAPCGLAARQLVRIIQKTIGEAVGQ